MRVVFDVEVYVNFFSCTFKNWDTQEITVFEISQRKNDLVSFIKFVSNIQYAITFNGVHYDNIIVMCLCRNFKDFSKAGYLYITKELKRISDLVINDDENINYNQYKQYKYTPYTNIDLFLFWSKLARKSKKLSLKSIAVNLNWHTIQELPIAHYEKVKLEEIDELLKYNLNDVLITEALAINKAKDINLRMDARKRYGFDCLSWDAIKIGLNIFITRYCDRTNRDIGEVKQLRTHRDTININEILLPIINFKEGSTNYRQFIEKGTLINEFSSFYGFWQYLKTLVVTESSNISCRIFYKDVRYDCGSGGLHNFMNSGVTTPKSHEQFLSIDASSYYPTIQSMWDIVPEHLGVEFAEELNAIRLERLDLKANGLGKSTQAELYKLILNGTFGNLNNDYTPLKDKKTFLSVTINCQLLLLMLCEKLVEVGASIDEVNTDGVNYIIDKSLCEASRQVCKDWEELTRMQLEEIEYKKIIRTNVNNYISIYEEKGQIKVKEKGMFLTDPPVDQSRDFLVIPKALKEYFLNGTPIEDFIRNHNNIYDFTCCQKVDKKYTVWYNGIIQQRLNRYFVTKTGAYLYKSKDNKTMEHMMKGFPVKMFNNFYEVPFEEYGINYNYYIMKTREILNELESKQLNLW